MRSLLLHGLRGVRSYSMSTVEQAKRAAAFMAVDQHVQNNTVVGVGSGSTVVYAVERLTERVKNENLQLKCVPTSFQARQLIISNNLVLADLETCPELDVAIDGADEVDAHLSCIKGGGGCQTQEKVVAAAAKKFVVVADYRKDSERLGQQWEKGLPVEVVPFAYKPVAIKMERMGFEPVLRMAKNKAGPVITDNGNVILDVKFDATQERDWKQVESNINNVAGVVEVGLFVGMANVAYFGMEDGTVKTRTP
eukprot:scpid87817/ scgid30582/ Ribose-5-phosphate isomerase; Phosphoriboisomerase